MAERGSGALIDGGRIGVLGTALEYEAASCLSEAFVSLIVL